MRSENDLKHALWLMRLSYLRYALKTAPDALKLFEQESEELRLSPQFKSLLEPFVPKSAKQVSAEPLNGIERFLKEVRMERPISTEDLKAKLDRKESIKEACSLRVAVIIFVVTTVIFFALSFVLFIFFLVWLLSKEDIGSYEPIKGV